LGRVSANSVSIPVKGGEGVVISVIDYGAGNLKSVANAFNELGKEVRISACPKDLEDSAAIVLPGVGAFGDGMRKLQEASLIDALGKAVLLDKKPFLGICLGMQFLANRGLEHGLHRGLGWIDGEVDRIEPNAPEFRIPHIGWNSIELQKNSTLFEGLPEAPVFYFLHSWSFRTTPASKDCVTSTCWHGTEICSSLERENIFAVQFHPEKSQRNGLKVLENFSKLI